MGRASLRLEQIHSHSGKTLWKRKALKSGMSVSTPICSLSNVLTPIYLPLQLYWAQGTMKIVMEICRGVSLPQREVRTEMSRH